MPDDRPLVLGADGVTAADVVDVARHGRTVSLGEDARLAIERDGFVAEGTLVAASEAALAAPLA